MTQQEIARIENVAKNFQFEGSLKHIEPWGNGHINDTYLLTFAVGKMGYIQVILQRINKNVFPKPEEDQSGRVLVGLYRNRVRRGGIVADGCGQR